MSKICNPLRLIFWLHGDRALFNCTIRSDHDSRVRSESTTWEGMGIIYTASWHFFTSFSKWLGNCSNFILGNIVCLGWHVDMIGCLPCWLGVADNNAIALQWCDSCARLYGIWLGNRSAFCKKQPDCACVGSALLVNNRPTVTASYINDASSLA